MNIWLVYALITKSLSAVYSYSMILMHL